MVCLGAKEGDSEDKEEEGEGDNEEGGDDDDDDESIVSGSDDVVVVGGGCLEELREEFFRCLVGVGLNSIVNTCLLLSDCSSLVLSLLSVISVVEAAR